MRSHSTDGDGRDADAQAGAGTADRDLFVTETMAELSARQGRLGDAVSIYRRLLAEGPPEDRRARWAARLGALEGSVGGDAAAPVPKPSTPVARAPATPAPPVDAPGPPLDSPLRLPLLIQSPVRSGQIVYAEGRDLIVLAPVNPGAQLLADGHIHVYAPLRGRAVAGVRGCVGAQIFCQKLDAELVGIDAAYIAAEELPVSLLGRPVRVWLDGGVCRLAAL